MNEDFDKKILEKVILKLAISSFEEKEQKSMNNKSKKVFQTTAVACCAIFSITGVAFAEDIGNYFKNLFGTNISEGIGTAIEQGYVANVETEYQTKEGISIKVDNMLMDDFNLAIDFNIKLDERYNADIFDGMYLKDLELIDELGNVVFVTHEYDKNKDYLGAYSFSTTIKDKNNLTLSFIATGNPEAFPKSKNLKVSFNNIETTGKNYTGNWKFNINVPEEFYNRETIIYKLKNCNDEKTKLNKAILSNTGLKIALVTSTNKVNYDAFHNSGSKVIIKEAYIETSNGKKYGVARKK